MPFDIRDLSFLVLQQQLIDKDNKKRTHDMVRGRVELASAWTWGNVGSSAFEGAVQALRSHK